MSTYLQTAIEDAMDFARAASGGGATRTPPPPRPPAPALTPAQQAAADAIVVRDFIKASAKARAGRALTVDTASFFYKRLTTHYLKTYLASPTAANGKAACETLIGKSFAGPATAGDRWEEVALSTWNAQPIPEFARKLRPALPATLAAATDILSRKNRPHLPYIDVPQLVGSVNPGTNFDDDVALGGKNISHLMHWGTGVKYSNLGQLTMRELFIAYEYWHLEAWDVFGEDPVNDLMVEESGRILGTGLRAATVTKANLLSKLNDALGEARAWVGTLLRARQAAFDTWIVATKQADANMWWGAGTPLRVWDSPSIYELLLSGKSVADVEKTDFVKRVIDIYTLIYDADAWEAKRGKIDNGTLIPNILSGSMDTIFSRMAHGQPVLSLAESLQATIEDYRSDATGTACATGPQTGAQALVRELGQRYGGRGEIFNCRPVRGGQRLSLHGEGRAVDWYRSASDPAQLAEAQRIIDWLLGTDAQGNEHAVARRMGVQEIIWNRRIWTARRHAEGWRAYDGVNPHTDHLHIGLNWPGARMQTSYWQPARAQSGGTVAPATAATGALRNAADIDARFNGSFIDWFNSTQANKAAWANRSMRADADTRRRFTQVWDGIPQMFGTATITLEQFVALQSIFINELGGAMAPLTERMGRTGHPGMAYLFDRIQGVKQSYNHAPNRTALQCFTDADFNTAHGGLNPGARLANTTDAAWGGEVWPAGEPTDMAAAPYIAQADFCKFRGRGMIQTTWRGAYERLVRWVQAYTGTNAKVVDYRTRWAGQDVQRVLTRSSNADWDDLFQNSGYALPWAGIRLHDQGAGGYLAISTDPAVRAGTAQGSFHNMGRRISGSSTYGDLFRRRCAQMLSAL